MDLGAHFQTIHNIYINIRGGIAKTWYNMANCHPFRKGNPFNGYMNPGGMYVYIYIWILAKSWLDHS